MTANPAPPRPLHTPAGSPALDPYLREYYVIRWRVCMTELHEVARVLGWQDRLPGKAVSGQS